MLKASIGIVQVDVKTVDEEVKLRVSDRFELNSFDGSEDLI
jgi:hypothetical protein